MKKYGGLSLILTGIIAFYCSYAGARALPSAQDQSWNDNIQDEPLSPNCDGCRVPPPKPSPSNARHNQKVLTKEGYKYLPSFSDTTWVRTLSLGAAWENVSQYQYISLTPDIRKTYNATGNRTTMAQAEYFIGLEKMISPIMQLQFGVAAAAAGNASIDGVIWDNADSEFDNHSYKYKIRHGHIAFKSKLLVEKWQAVSPWISISLGLGINQAFDFTNTVLISEAITNNNFSDRSQLSVTYTLGAGIEKFISQYWKVGLGYEFSDWGKSQLGSAFQQTINSGPGLNNLYTHAALLSLTYLD